MWVLCECNVNVMWVQCECNVSAMWMQCECNVSAMWVQCECKVSAMWVQCECTVSAIWVQEVSAKTFRLRRIWAFLKAFFVSVKICNLQFHLEHSRDNWRPILHLTSLQFCIHSLLVVIEVFSEFLELILNWKRGEKISTRKRFSTCLTIHKIRLFEFKVHHSGPGPKL